MPFLIRRSFWAALAASAIACGSVPAWAAASPDFYGIKMNSENHARDLSPDELSLFPVRRGFDKNIYAYGHLDTAFNHTRSIVFTIYNNTDNDLLVEKSFREYYVVLRNGERYRLNEPGMLSGGIGGVPDAIAARSSGALRAEFGDLNVTKEQIEMVVCSFDMGKVKIVLLPIAMDVPPPLPAQDARAAVPAAAKEGPAPLSRDQVEPRIRGENEVRRAGAKPGGRFPVMDLPIFSWIKNASKPPETEIKEADAARASAGARETAPDKSPKKAAQTAETMPKPFWSASGKAAGVPKTAPPEKKAKAKPAEPVKIDALPAAPAAGKPAPKRKGLFGALFSVFERDESAPSLRSSANSKDGSKPAAKRSLKPATPAIAPPPGEKEFFWKPRDLAPIPSIDEYQKQEKGEKKQAPSSKSKPAPKISALSGTAVPEAKPFYMRRMLDDSVKIPADEPVTAVSAPKSKDKAPVLKPEKKLRKAGPRVDAKVSQVNRQMGFIIVNAGSADGLRENSVLNVYRGGRVIAKAVVRQLREDAAAALLMKEWAHADVAAGDAVSLY